MGSGLTSAMHKKMDRRDFLKYSFGVLLAVIGITGLLKTLEGVDDQKSGGYGNSSYGG